MRIGDLLWHKAHGLCAISDYVDESETVCVVAYAVGGRLKFAILNEGDAIPVAIAPQLEQLIKLVKGQP